MNRAPTKVLIAAGVWRMMLASLSASRPTKVR
jgi:hypothetical protein